MVNSSYKQHLQVTQSPKASPVFINGAGAGNVRIGTGNIGTPQVAKPAYLQYIPAPTSHGAKTGDMVASLSEQINKTSLQIADAEARHFAAIKSSKDRAMLHELAYRGADGTGGILTKRGVEFLGLRQEATRQMHELIAQSAEELEPAAASYYIASMQKHAKVITGQIESKYLLETADVEQEASKLGLADSMANALAVSENPRKASAFLYENYKLRVKAKGRLTEQDLAAGASDKDALNDVALEFAEGLTAAPGNSARLEPYLDMLQGMLQPSGQKKLINILQSDTDLALKIDKDSRMRMEEGAKAANEESRRQLATGMLQARSEGKLAAFVQNEKDKLIKLPQGGLRVKFIEDMYDALKQDTGDVSVPVEAKAWVAEQAALGTPAVELATAARAKGFSLDAKTLNNYVVSYESKLNSNISDIQRRLKDQVSGFVEDSKGPGKGGGFFFLKPEAKAWVSTVLADSYERLSSAYRKGSGGAEGRAAAQKEAHDILMGVKTGQWNSSMVAVTRAMVDRTPKKYSVVGVIMPGDADMPLEDTLYSDKVVSRVTDYTSSLDPAAIKQIHDPAIRSKLAGVQDWNAFFEARAILDKSGDPGLSALHFFRKVRLLQVRGDSSLDVRTMQRYMHDIIDQVDVMKSKYTSERSPVVDTATVHEEAPASRIDSLINTGREMLSNKGTN